MENYIIVSRVLSSMSEPMRELWAKNAPENDKKDVLPISDSNMTLVNGEKLAENNWGKLLKLKEAEHLDKATRADLKKWLEGILGEETQQRTHLFIHFGGKNDKEVINLCAHLKRCFEGYKVYVIPFTVNATSSSVIENAKFLDIHEKGNLEAELNRRAYNYVARIGVFGWLEAYEKSIFIKKEFEAPKIFFDKPTQPPEALKADGSNKEAWEIYNNDSEKYNQSEGKYKATQAEFEKFKAELKESRVIRTSPPKLSAHTYNLYSMWQMKHKKEDAKHKKEDANKLSGKDSLKFKIGIWDNEQQAPKAVDVHDFKQFRMDFAKIYDAKNIVSPREEVFDAWLIVHQLKDLQKANHLNRRMDAAESAFLQQPKPMLSVGLMPFWEISGTNTPLSIEFRHNYLDPRLNFWDSCIWCRYVPLLSTNWCIDQKEALENVIAHFYQYKKDGLYETISSQEFLAFHLRMYQNAFVSGVAEQVIRAHGGAVTPFSFHSETKIEEETKVILEELGDLKWRVLLVDDNSETGLPTVHKGKKSLTKRAIIEKAIHNMDLVELTAKTTIKEAKDCIEAEEHYDIILLDYLFQKTGKNEFGIDFLKDILKGDKNPHLEQSCLGPLGKHYIIPISVYQNALTDNLHDAAILTNGDKWLITQGTDPLNKPNLFRFILLRLMSRQLKKAFIGNALLKDFREDATHVDIMNETRKAYLSIIAKSDNLNGLIKFYDKSLFATHLINQKFAISKKGQDKVNKNDILTIAEHFQHLFVLIVNANTQYKPQMWEEYFWLKDRLMPDNKQFWDNIKQYIQYIKS